MGMFLFMLFFQPFPNKFSDLNSGLIFNAGFGAIVFILLNAIHLFSKIFKHSDKEILSYFNGIILLIVTTVAFTFFLRYVGEVNIKFYSVAMVALICLAPPVALRIYRRTNELRQDNDLLLKENLSLQNQLHSLANDNPFNTIVFHSADGSSEVMKLLVPDLILIKSADNYVEIYYRDNNTIRKKLIRNTLRNIEQLLTPYNQFIRCHRTCIINAVHIDKLHLKINSSYIIVKDLDEHIPVSRQYILKLKEAASLKQG